MINVKKQSLKCGFIFSLLLIGIFIICKMADSDYFILIDSGGTNCRIATSFDSLNIINSSVYPSVHFTSNGLNGFSAHLSHLVEKYTAENALQTNECAGICVGAAGARNISQRNDISAEISRITGIRNVITESDSEIAYEAYFGTGDGLLIICGTGSVLYGKHAGTDVRIGGWGKLLGDTGSSYSLSLKVLRRLTRDFDLNDEYSETEKLLEKEYGISRYTIIDEIYHKNFNIAGLAPFFVKLAGQGNELCRNAVENEIKGISDLVEIFLNKCDPEGTVDIAFTGGLFEEKNFFSEKLFKLLKYNFSSLVNLKKEFKNPLEGALKIAARRII
jgi:N-acetylglucosamine kinase-like BadF-type ATPase